jgi:hypothetical protein
VANPLLQHLETKFGDVFFQDLQEPKKHVIECVGISNMLKNV